MSRDVETLTYNIRMIIDSKVKSEPRAWLISKINRISPNGICRVTLAQDVYDEHSDYIECDSDGNIIGMWANYYSSNIEPVSVNIDDGIPSTVTAKIICSGKPQFKIGGSAKTFTVTFYDNENQEITDHEVGSWALFIDDVAVPNTLLELTTDGNKLKVKFLGDDSYIGKILTVTNTSDDIETSIQTEIIAL